MLINKRLRELREEKGLLETNIADILRITLGNYSRWELGIKIIPLKHLNKLCNYYDITLDYFFELSKNNNNTNIKKINVLDKKIIGERINKFRTDNKLSFNALAKELNTTASTLHSYEKGKTLILTAFAYQLCKKYNVSLDWLCGKK